MEEGHLVAMLNRMMLYTQEESEL